MMHSGFVLKDLRAHAKANDVGQTSPALASTSTLWTDDIKRILCVRLDNLGDVLMTSPAIAILKHAFPDRHITLLTSSAGAPVAPFIPEIDDLIVFDPPWAKHEAIAGGPACQVLVELLASKRFDAAVIFTVYSQSPLPAAMLCLLAGIPNRLAHCRENPYSVLTAWAPEREPDTLVRHEVQRQLDLVATVQGQGLSQGLSEGQGSRLTQGRGTGESSGEVPPRMRFILRPSDRVQCSRGLAKANVGVQSPYIVMHPGCTAASRRYPSERFAEAAASIARDTQMKVILTGTRDEAPLLNAIRHLAQEPLVMTLPAELSLGAFGALLENAALLISNNTGPVHIAAALQTPVVDIYALTNPQHTPWGTAHRVLFNDVPCRWCYKSTCPQQHHQCLEGVSVNAVVDAAFSLLSETGFIAIPGTTLHARQMPTSHEAPQTASRTAASATPHVTSHATSHGASHAIPHATQPATPRATQIEAPSATPYV